MKMEKPFGLAMDKRTLYTSDIVVVDNKSSMPNGEVCAAMTDNDGCVAFVGARRVGSRCVVLAMAGWPNISAMAGGKVTPPATPPTPSGNCALGMVDSLNTNSALNISTVGALVDNKMAVKDIAAARKANPMTMHTKHAIDDVLDFMLKEGMECASINECHHVATTTTLSVNGHTYQGKSSICTRVTDWLIG